MNSSLNSFVVSKHQFIVSKRPKPEPLATSQEIRDRGSTFVANIYSATTPDEASHHHKARIEYLKQQVVREDKDEPASHEIAAWRCMVLKQGRTGLKGPEDFELMQGSKDDGESLAGGKVLKVMQDLAIIDAVVIVSRRYGGTLLGPARFTHIETCASEVCREFKRSEELRECITTLQTYDDLLLTLRAQLSSLTTQSSTTSTSIPKHDSKKKDYKGMDVAKAKRLIQARENSLKSVKSLIEKVRTGHITDTAVESTGPTGGTAGTGPQTGRVEGS